MRTPILAGLTAAMAGAAFAPIPPTQSANEPASNEVRGVVVTARRPTDLAGVTVTANACRSRPVPDGNGARATPHVVETYPAQGAVAPAGTLSLRVVFDQPMFPCSFAYEPDFPLQFPRMQGRAPALAPDGRTFIVQTEVKPGLDYGVRFNSPSHAYFVSRAGVPAEPLELRFSTAPAF